MFIKNTKLLLIVVLSAIFGIAVAADRETINPLHELKKRVHTLELQAIDDFRELSERHVELFKAASNAKADAFIAGRAIEALQKQVGDKTADIETRLAFLEFSFGLRLRSLEEARKKDLERIAFLERYVQEKFVKS